MKPIPATMAVERATRIATIVLFAGCLLAPTVDMWIRPASRRDPSPELRTAAPAPAIPKDGSQVFAFPRAFDAHWNDTFGLRDVLLRAHSMFCVFGLGVAPSRQHVLGRDRWIFNRQDSILDNHRGIIPFTDGELENWRLRLERRAAECAKRGVHYLFTLCPDKPTIYPEFLPSNIRKIGPTRMDQLLEYLRTHSKVDVVDLRPALLDEKRKDDPTTDDFVYYPLGTHWTTRGGLRAVNELLIALGTRFQGVQPLALDRFIEGQPSEYGDTEARSMYLVDQLTQREHLWAPRQPRHQEIAVSRDLLRYRITEIDDPSLPRAVVFHDSFGAYVERSLAEAFSHLEMVWSYDFDLRRIEASRPDIVIEMIVERALVFQEPRTIMPGELLGPRTEFQAATRTLFQFDPTQPDASLDPIYRARISTAATPSGPVAVLESRGPPDVFALRMDPIELTGTTLLIRIEVDSPRPDHFTVFYKRRQDTAWSHDRCVKTTTLEGANELFFAIDTGDGIEGLILQPLDLSGKVNLRSLEIRVN